MKIEIQPDDFGTLCVCALRYCHGRQTYMPYLVQRIVLEHWDKLRELDKGVIREDQAYQRRFDLWGSDYDKEGWEDFYRQIADGAAAPTFVCDACGATFSVPDKHCYRENLDGEQGIETVWEDRCPHCGSEEIREESL